MKTLKKYIILLIIICFGIMGCSESKTEKTIEYADNLQIAIEKFEKSRTKASNVVNEVTTDTIEDLNDDKPDLRGVAKSWESEWKDVKRRFSNLEDDFSDVAKSSRSYFDQLEKLADDINNKSLKESEENKNAQLKTSWTETFTKASNDIEKLRILISEGNDFHNVLLGATLREKLAQNIEDLKNISQRAKSLLSNLERLTIEGKKLAAK